MPVANIYYELTQNSNSHSNNFVRKISVIERKKERERNPQQVQRKPNIDTIGSPI